VKDEIAWRKRLEAHMDVDEHVIAYERTFRVFRIE